MKSDLLPELGDLQALLDRLTPGRPDRLGKTIFLVGSALGAPGVPGVSGMVQLVLDHLAKESLDSRKLREKLTGTTEDYQTAFSELNLRCGPDAVNLVVRQAVGQAYRQIPERLDDRACEELEEDLQGWTLTPAAEALGRIAARAPGLFGTTVLTTNFDPLIEVAIRRAGGVCYRTVLQGDGTIEQTVAPGCRVVHSHGYWYGSDTLHTPFQLQEPRPQLAASLRKLLDDDGLLVVVGFGGWKDAFTSTLADLAQARDFPKVLWAFHENSPVEIADRYESLLRSLRPALNSGRLSLYRGIDAHELLPQLAERLEHLPMETLSLAGKPAAGLRQDYLRQLQLDCNRTRLVGLDSASADPGQGKSISLDQVYVSLDTRSFEPPEKYQSPKPISAVQAVWNAREGRSVLLGSPGSGKSTFLRVLALRLARACASPDFDLKENLPGWEGEPLLPILIPLAFLAQEVGPRNGFSGFQIESFLERSLDKHSGLPGLAALLQRELEGPGAMVLFDGLDEIVDSGLRETVREAIEGFAVRYPRSRIVVTCRTYSYSDPRWRLSGWPVHHLAPLTPSQIDLFIEQWYREQQQVDPGRASFYEAKARLFRKALSPGDGRRLHEIADNPLLLTVMAVVHTHRSELPDARASVYRECVDLLLLRWQALRTAPAAEPVNLVHALGVANSTLQRALQEAAYNAYHGRVGQDGKTAGTITRDVLVAALDKHLGDFRKVETFLEYCEKSNGLLFFQGTVQPESSEDVPVKIYSFPHRTFQEYLAALYLVRQPNLGGRLNKLLNESAEWREVIILLAEHLCFTENNAEQVETIVRHLIPKARSGNSEDAYWRAAWVAGDLLDMLRRTLTGKSMDKALVARTIKLLVRLLEASSLPPRERAAAARSLAALGDPRQGVGNQRAPSGTRDLPDIRWARIEGGTLRMGAAPEEKWETPAAEEEIGKPYPTEWGPGGKRFPVEISPFQLAIYPVTLEQFRLFKKDDGYTNPSYWTSHGWEWLQKKVKFGVPLTLAHDTERALNQPVTPVTWHEAVAFCRWITVRYREEGLLDAGEVIRLPTEAEWEWAARGPEGLIWPWGNQWRPGACNSSETEIGGSCAVGLFPSGMNWTGDVWDLAGNVLEWCSTKWVEEYEADWRERSGRNEWDDEYLKGNAVRTLRGGYPVSPVDKEDIYLRVTRGACRFFYPPTVVDQTLGYSLRLLRA